MAETLSQISLGILPLLGLTFAAKEIIRRGHPLYGQERIEVAHIQDKFLGGTEDRSNLVPLTLPEHLVDHVTKAKEAENWGIAARHYGAASLIAARMTPNERDEANRMISNSGKSLIYENA